MSVETNNKIGVEVRRAKNLKKKQKHHGRLGNFYILTGRICNSFIWSASDVKLSPQRDMTRRLRRRFWDAIRDLDGKLLLFRGAKQKAFDLQKCHLNLPRPTVTRKISARLAATRHTIVLVTFHSQTRQEND